VKLLGLVALLVLAMVGLGLYNVQITARVAKGGDELYHNDTRAIENSLEIRGHFLEITSSLIHHILMTNLGSDSEEEAALEKSITEAFRQIQEHLGEYGKLETEKEKQELLKEIQAYVIEYEPKVQAVVELSRTGQSKQAFDQLEEMEAQTEEALRNVERLAQISATYAEEKGRANEALVASSRINALAAIAAVAVLSVLVGLWVANLVVNPVRQVHVVAEALVEGDLGKRAQVASRDEVGLMAGAINQAVENLRDLVAKVADSSEQVAASSEELSSSAQVVGQVTQQVAETITQLANGADEQARQSQETGQLVGNMFTFIQQVAASAQQMSKYATGAVTKAEHGRAAVNQAVNQMATVRQTVEESAGAVRGLGERSQEIGNIVEVITGIADQTNLLALNAAIEAARAGEQGRGFAVVAEEVRKLAEQSREAAKRISTLIREIQGETVKAVSSMEAGTKEVAAGTEVVVKSGKAFEAIVNAVETVVGQIQEMSTATQQLVTGSEQVVKSVESIAAITEESAAGMEEVSTSAEEQSASVQKIVASAESLAQLAQELRKAVARFKL
jgi:methyl-accepting chemotaxis protein